MVKNKITPAWNKARTKYINPTRKRVTTFAQQHALLSVFILLGLLLIFIAVAQFIRNPQPEEVTEEQQPTLVDTYSFGESPTLTLSARVEKSGVINVYAQSPGIVQNVQVTEGQEVGRGSTLVSLSTNYQGGNVSSLSRQIAQKNFEFTRDNFELQKDLIGRQREIANQGETQADELREIGKKSLDDTRSLISLTEEVVDGLDDQISFLESMNVNGASDNAILAAKQGKAGALASLNQLRSGLRTAEYQSSDDETSADMTRSSRDLTLKQLELQEKSLVLSKDISEINYKLARVTEGLMYPASPCAGVVERVYVSIGESVSPGTLIATIKSDQGENTAVVLVPADIAKSINKAEASEFTFGDSKVELFPRYISTEATEGTLHSILYSIPTIYSDRIVNSSSISVQVPIGSQQIVTEDLYVPLDSVYQTQQASYVYVVENVEGKQVAKNLTVGLGAVSGEYVRVTNGLTASDTVITSRSIQDGDQVRVE